MEDRTPPLNQHGHFQQAKLDQGWTKMPWGEPLKEMQEVVVGKQGLLVLTNWDGTRKVLLKKDSNSEKTMEKEAKECWTPEGKV